MTESRTRSTGQLPRFAFSAHERSALRVFLSLESPTSLARSHPAETSRRLTSALRCAACHDRDGQPAHLNHVLVEEGRGLLPKPAPTLTWAGEKLWPEWTARLLKGDFVERTRPWLKTRMPAFAHSADVLAAGLAHEHGVPNTIWSDHRFDEARVALGQQLTTQQALDCRQCHGIGHLQPRGDEKTKIHLGINFTHVRERLRPDYYQRFTMNPPRYEPQSNMPRLTDAVMRTKIRNVLDGDARAQFDAIWQAIQALDPKDRPRAEGLPE